MGGHGLSQAAVNAAWSALVDPTGRKPPPFAYPPMARIATDSRADVAGTKPAMEGVVAKMQGYKAGSTSPDDRIKSTRAVMAGPVEAKWKTVTPHPIAHATHKRCPMM